MLKEQWHCEDDDGDFRILDGTSLETSFGRCPKSYFNADIDEILWLWREWRDHKPPVEGGSWAQPNWLTEVFKVLEVVYFLVEEEKAKCRS